MDEQISRIPIKIVLPDIGETEGELNRLTAPLTVEEIVRKLPISGRVHKIQRGVSMIIGIQKGIEKPVNQVEKGTITYWPRGDTLQIYLDDSKTRGSVNNIGKVIGSMELFNQISLGSRMIIQMD
jgi:hypothetical protein